MALNKAIPFAAVTFVIASMASMGLPGFSGFAAEFQVLIGAWKAFPTFAIITGGGIVIGVAYTLRVMQKAFFGDAEERRSPDRHEGTEPGQTVHQNGAPLEPISVPEKLGAIILIGVSLLIGVFPRLLLDVIVASFDSPLFDWLRRAP
jgi:NADH-quinone oxidoreductase subunit M